MRIGDVAGAPMLAHKAEHEGVNLRQRDRPTKRACNPASTRAGARMHLFAIRRVALRRH